MVAQLQNGVHGGRLKKLLKEPMGYVDGMSRYQVDASNPMMKVDPTGFASEPATSPNNQPVQLTDGQNYGGGVAYHETAGIYPQLVAGATKSSLENWDPASEQQLSHARMWIAAISRNGGKTVGPDYPTGEEMKNPVVQRAAADCKEAGRVGEPSKIDKDVKHFFIWPSSDGKAPDPIPAKKDQWPRTESDKIIAVYGPFRVLKKVGDVPVSDSIYIFIYKGVK